MERATVPARTHQEPAFDDGLGERRHTLDPTGTEALELLCIRGELAAVPSFEFALRERVGRLAAFRHPGYGRVRGVERLTDGGATLSVVSERTEGIRLSELLLRAERRQISLDINTALCLLRQLVPAAALMHEHGDASIANGAIAPEHLIVTPGARVVVVEYVLGAALEQLRFSQERYWSELRIPLPRTVGLPRFDRRADVTQLGAVALSLILGRLLREDEYPARVEEVLASTWAVSARGGFEPLPPGLRGWIGRALQLDSRTAFATAVEARLELDKVIGDSEYIASPASLDAFLAKCGEAAAPPPAPQAARVSQTLPPRVKTPAPVPPTPSVPHPPASAVAPSPATASRAPVMPLPAAVPPSQAAFTPLPPRVGAPTVPTRPPATVPRAAMPVLLPSPVAAPAPRPPTPAVPASGRVAETVQPLRPQATTTPPPTTPPPAAPSRAPVRATRLTPSPPAAVVPAPVAVVPPPVAAVHEPARPAASPPPDRGFYPGTVGPALDPSAGDRVPEPNLFDEQLKPARRRWPLFAAVAVMLVAVAGGGILLGRQFIAPTPAALTTGTLLVTTSPAGVAAFVDGQHRGTTPLTLTLAAGTHLLELRGAGEPRTIPLTIAAGAQLSQYLELAPAAATSTGQLQIRTDPPGAQVSVDDVPQGISPLVVTELAAGDHTVVLESALGVVKQTVAIESGVTASLIVPMAAPPSVPASGWIAITAPVEMQLYEQGRFIGSSQSERIMVSAGRHEIEVVNEALGYRTTRVVQVAPGKVAGVKLEMPMGTIALNAVPWAEVWIDGVRAGETPIGNLPIAVGPHEIVFRHPELGEQRHATTVTLTGPARLSVDLRKP